MLFFTLLYYYNCTISFFFFCLPPEGRMIILYITTIVIYSIFFSFVYCRTSYDIYSIYTVIIIQSFLFSSCRDRFRIYLDIYSYCSIILLFLFFLPHNMLRYCWYNCIIFYTHIYAIILVISYVINYNIKYHILMLQYIL